jgi:hypothetical protein
MQHCVRGAAHQIAQVIVRRALQHGVNRTGEKGEQLRVCVRELGAQLVSVNASGSVLIGVAGG